MPTSKSRKRKLVARQKRREITILRTKSRLGLNVQSRSLQKNTTISNPIAVLTACLKKAIKSSAKDDPVQNNITAIRKDIVAESMTMTTTNTAAENIDLNLYQNDSQMQTSHDEPNTEIHQDVVISFNNVVTDLEKKTSSHSSAKDASTYTMMTSSGKLFKRSIDAILHIGYLPLAITRRIIQVYCVRDHMFL